MCAAFEAEVVGMMDMPPKADETSIWFCTLYGSNGTDGAKMRAGIILGSTDGFR